MATLRDKITQDYNTISSTATKSTLSGADLQGAIAYAKEELRKVPTEPTLKSWLTIIAQRESDNTEIRSQLDDLKDFLDAQGKRIIPAPVVDNPGKENPNIQTNTLDSLGVLAWQKVLEQDLRDELQKHIKSMDGKLEKMSSEDLDSAILLTSNILNLTWMERIPGFKEKSQEILQYEPMLQGIAGANLLKKLQKLGYSLYFTGTNQIKIISTQPDAQDVEVKMNAHLAKSTVLAKSIQSWLLYGSPSFHAYRASVTNNEGKIIDPAHVDMKTYTEYLRKKPANTLDPNEKVFLQSVPYLDRWINFQSALTQSRDYAKVIGMMEQYTGDKNVADLLPKGLVQPTGSVSQSVDDSAAAKVGRGVGWIAGVIGKIAGAGAGGGLEFLGTAMREAWPLWSVAIIGAILWSIFSSKWLGFMGTMGAIFGVGLLTKADELKWILPKWKDKGTENPAASALAASAGSPWSQPSDTTKSEPTQPAQLLTSSALIAQSLGRENIHDADVAKEQAVIDTLKWMSAEKLETALKTGNEADWNKAIESTGLKIGTPEYDALAKVINKENVFARDVMKKYVTHLMNNEYIKALTPEQKQSKSLEQMANIVIEKENEKKKEGKIEGKKAPDVVPPPELFTLSKGHSNLYLLARLMTQGYIPQLSDNAWADRKTQPLWDKFKYFTWDGGPLTNNKDSKNPLVWAWHNGLQEKVSGFTLAQVADEKNMISEALTAMKSKNIDGKSLIEAELLERKWKADILETVLKTAPLDEKALKNALSAFESSVKTKWEIIGNKLWMKWGANGWKIFNPVNIDLYVAKAESIVNKERQTITGADLETFKINQTPIEMDGKKYVISDIKSGSVYYKQVRPDGTLAWDWKMDLDKCLSTINKPLEVAKIQTEAIRLGEIIDAEKSKVISSFEAWEAAPKDAIKKQSAMTALEWYNKLVVDSSGRVSEGFALMTQDEAKVLAAKIKSGWFLSEFIHANTAGNNFGWANTVDKFTSTTDYVKWARRGFVWVWLLTVAYNSGWGLTDLIKDGSIGTAMTRVLDLGIGMVPFVGSVHDAAILSFPDYERWMLGAKLSDEERNMRKAMIVLGVIPGVGIAVKWVGKVAKIETLLAWWTMIVKSGNLARSVAMYSMLGMSLVATGFEINKKLS
jgi:hypothetical protein